jgi:hypothetical protein
MKEIKRQSDYEVVVTKYGKEIFRYKVDSLLTANGFVKTLCSQAMEKKSEIFFSIYENGIEIVNGEHFSEDSFYYYSDFRPEMVATYKMPCNR